MIFYVLCALLIVFSAVSNDDIQQEDTILELNQDNFKTIINKNDFILVEFYDPLCDYCDSLAAEYTKVAQKLAEKNSSIKLGKVDVFAETNLAEKYQIRDYPTFKFFCNGSPIEYNGEHEADNIIAWIKRKSEPPVKELETIDEIENFIKENEIAIIGFFNGKINIDVKAFISAAENLDSFVFGIVRDETVFSKYEVDDGNLILFKPFDIMKSVFKGKLELNEIKKFAQIHSIPLILDFSYEYAKKIIAGPVHSLLLYFLSKGEGHHEYVQQLREIAINYRDHILYTIISTDDDNNTSLYEFFGISKKKLPTICAIQREDLYVYMYIKYYSQKVKRKKQKRHLPSQELVKSWDKQFVKVLVPSNFGYFAYDVTKDLLIEFYAPWDGTCKRLAPIFDQLVEKFKDNDSIIIARMDVTSDELKHTPFTSFSIVKLFRKGDNKVFDYTLERTFDNFIHFLEVRGDIAPAFDIIQETNDKEDKQKLELLKEEL